MLAGGSLPSLSAGDAAAVVAAVTAAASAVYMGEDSEGRGEGIASPVADAWEGPQK